MRAMVFDSSSIITLATNNLLWTLKHLKEKFQGNFYITEGVKEEVIDRPLKTRKFKLEAMQILALVSEGIVEIYSNKRVQERAAYFSNLANNIFEAHGNFIKIVQKGEMESLALVEYLSANAFVIDERTTRVLIEEPTRLAKLFSHKLHTPIKVNKNGLRAFKELVNVNVIRSVELMTIAYEMGLLNKYLNEKEKEIANIDLNKTLLEGLLWGLRLKGCAISTNEINEIMRLKGFSGRG